MNVREVAKKPNSLKVVLRWSDEGEATSPEFVINGVVQFAVRANTFEKPRCRSIHVQFTKLRPADDRTYMICFNSVMLDIKNKTFTSDDGKWYEIYHSGLCWGEFDMTAEMQIVPSANSFASLHGDTELTDFELRGEDGAVRVHRAVLAAASPVLRRMLAGAWREAREGHVDVSGTSAATLEHLKDYLYLQTLPESGLEQLLLLSSYYIMPEMEQRCIDKLLQGVTTAESLKNLIEFSIKNDVNNLFFTIMEYLQCGAYDVTKMRDHLNKDIPTTDDDESKVCGNCDAGRCARWHRTSYKEFECEDCGACGAAKFAFTLMRRRLAGRRATNRNRVDQNNG